MNDLTIYKQTSQNALETHQDVEVATLHLSQLNTILDQITAHKEKKLRPALDTIKAIRDDYREVENDLNTLISKYRNSLTAYATHQEQQKRLEEAKILSNTKTSLTTKVSKLATLEENTTGSEKVTTTAGSISFTTTIKYRLIDPAKCPVELLELNTTLLKDHLKQGNPLPQGIEKYEEKSLRNYRG